MANDDMPSTTKRPRPFRVVVLGAQRIRVQKVAAILNNQESLTVIDSNDLLAPVLSVAVEYLPCVAKFDSYEGADGKQVRYLVSVDYYGEGGLTKTPGGLVPFFDEAAGQAETAAGDKVASSSADVNNKSLQFGPIACVAIGCGIESDQDVASIETFFKNFTDKLPTMECVRPNQEFDTMQQETAAYKALDADGKAQVTSQKTMGPGKMAKFTTDFVRRIVQEALDKQTQENSPTVVESVAAVGDQAVQVTIPHAIDPEKTRYSCRKCRTVLFGEDDLEDPPHGASQHRFSYRKMNHSGPDTVASPCQSLFLGSSMDWMGDVSAAEGKFTCSVCDTKLGSYTWSGAQCSCGTWVVPAVRVPKSKVDVVQPHQPELPAGTIVSPIIQQMLEQQQQQREQLE